MTGDQIIFSDGNTFTLENISLNDITVPSGKHKVVLVESRISSYVGLSGEALIELHNFPTLSSVDTIDTCPDNSRPNLVKVPTILPSNITDVSYMFAGLRHSIKTLACGMFLMSLICITCLKMPFHLIKTYLNGAYLT